jgi:1-acyl-sn-glycerol-3-phosphate acyltransferase
MKRNTQGEVRPGIPSVAEIWRRPLPHLDGQRSTRWIVRTVITVFHRQVRELHGLEAIGVDRDPFILAPNHSQRPEAMLVPAWLSFHRGGRMVHFMADWNFLLIPVIGAMIRCHDPIVVTRKPAKPAFLNRYKARYAGALPPFEEARRRLADGKSVGVFPEGTTNRHPAQMLRGHHGAAQLALDSGAPVVTAGIRFIGNDGRRPIRDTQPFTVRFGPLPAQPAPSDGHVTDVERTRQFHHRLMTAISTACGKGWQPDGRRSKYALDQD